MPSDSRVNGARGAIWSWVATRALFVGGAWLIAGACGGAEGDVGQRGPLIVYNAGSLARPLRSALDTFSARTGIEYEQESAGSLETARKLTELGKIPDVIALADHEVFPQLLMPEHVTWYARFARNRMVLMYSPRSRFADEITPNNWREIVLRPGVQMGRADPDLDPAGYRTVMAMQLAERHYGESGLARRFLEAAPERNMRPKEVDLVALVQAGELDYVWIYESVARAADLPYVTLPHEMDLGTPEDAARYDAAVVRVMGKGVGDTITLRGSPIIYGFSVPIGAPHPDVAREFAAFLLGEGKEVLRAAHLPVFERAVVVGSGAPAEVTAAVNP